MANMDYVLITTARNEEMHIEKTIKSVINQTVKPKMFVIVSDGSVDRTDEIILKYKESNNYIYIARRESKPRRDFASKVYAFKVGLDLVIQEDYDFIGNLDADVSLDPDYYQKVLERFKQCSRLGIAGGEVYDYCSGSFRRLVSSINSVNGMIQFFRRECFEQIGGYLPLRRGGIDMMAEVSARMHGWNTCTLVGLKVLHHRRSGTENRNIYSARYLQGKTEFVNGYHFLFELARCLIRIKERPYAIGSIARFAGYCSCLICGENLAVPEELVRYLRKEQMARLIGRGSKGKIRGRR